MADDAMGAFGDKRWPGLAKVLEEAGEIGQVGGKLVMTHGSCTHWEGPPLNERLVDEMADEYAAITFMMKHTLEVNHMVDRFMTRWQAKLALFEKWHMEGDNDRTA